VLSRLLSFPSRSFLLLPLLLLLLLLLLLQLGMVSIPAAVVSMLSVPLLLSALNPSTADEALEWFDSCIAPWTTDLLGLFYVPAVAVLPVLLRGMQGEEGGRGGCSSGL